MLHIIKNYPLLLVKWALYGVALLLLKLLSIFLSPALAGLSMLIGKNVLPYPLNLFHTHDDTLDGGQSQLGWPDVSGVKLWWQRTKWIARNPAYGFSAYVLGFKNEGVKVLYEKGEWVDDWNDGKLHYHAYVYEDSSGRKFFGFRNRYKLFGMIMSCWIGWNWDLYDGETHQLKIAIINRMKP
uniref:Uncharacterized protein n=1 Tax=Ochrobactrum phage ORM_20 TaxID=2985243 RepID=A0A9N6WZT0_9VIRU|nr:hypothetical protein ORM20_00064 [Ochrobactrum phage ORM_20]